MRPSPDGDRRAAVSATRATYQVTFSLAFGTHEIHATATDLGRNKRTTSITIHNTA